MSTPVDASHVAASLQKLHFHQDQSISLQESGTDMPSAIQRVPTPREGYGFRKSGVSTPVTQSEAQPTSQLSLDSLVPDPNGLGWPGASSVDK